MMQQVDDQGGEFGAYRSETMSRDIEQLPNRRDHQPARPAV